LLLQQEQVLGWHYRMEEEEAFCNLVFVLLFVLLLVLLVLLVLLELVFVVALALALALKPPAAVVAVLVLVSAETQAEERKVVAQAAEAALRGVAPGQTFERSHSPHRSQHTD